METTSTAKEKASRILAAKADGGGGKNRPPRSTLANDEILPWEQRPNLPVSLAARVIGVSPGTIYSLEKGKYLEFVRLPGLETKVHVTTASIVAYLAGAKPWTPSKHGEGARKKRIELAAQQRRW